MPYHHQCRSIVQGLSKAVWRFFPATPIINELHVVHLALRQESHSLTHDILPILPFPLQNILSLYNHTTSFSASYCEWNTMSVNSSFWSCIAYFQPDFFFTLNIPLYMPYCCLSLSYFLIYHCNFVFICSVMLYLGYSGWKYMNSIFPNPYSQFHTHCTYWTSS